MNERTNERKKDGTAVMHRDAELQEIACKSNMDSRNVLSFMT